jgi:hypothetical protein
MPLDDATPSRTGQEAPANICVGAPSEEVRAQPLPWRLALAPDPIGRKPGLITGKTFVSGLAPGCLGPREFSIDMAWTIMRVRSGSGFPPHRQDPGATTGIPRRRLLLVVSKLALWFAAARYA